MFPLAYANVIHAIAAGDRSGWNEFLRGLRSNAAARGGRGNLR